MAAMTVCCPSTTTVKHIVRQYEYDRRGYPTRTKYSDGTTEIRVPDNTGNLYETLNRSDRKYGRGGQLKKTAHWSTGMTTSAKERHTRRNMALRMERRWNAVKGKASRQRRDHIPIRRSWPTD